MAHNSPVSCFASSLSIKHSPNINTSHVGSETNGLHLHTGALLYFPVPSHLISVPLVYFCYCSWSTLSLCDATVRKNDLFAQPQALNSRKQSDALDVLAKHCTSEACITTIYGNPITVGSSEYWSVFSAKCLYTEEQVDIGLILGILKAEILTYILSTWHCGFREEQLRNKLMNVGLCLATVIIRPYISLVFSQTSPYFPTQKLEETFIVLNISVYLTKANS